MDILKEKETAAEPASTLPMTAHMAYVRPVSKDKSAGFAVCASDGTQLAVFATEDAAYFAAKQHDLEPVLVH
jgi:hypothetical protein